MTIRYRLDRCEEIKLRLVDSAGRQVAVFYHGVQSTGQHQASIPTGKLASGIYVIEMRSPGDVHRRVMVEVK